MFKVQRSAFRQGQASSLSRPRRGQAGSLFHVLLGFLLCCATLAGSVSPAFAKGKGGLALRDGKTRIEMPPLARVVYRDATGKSWGVSGEISGSLEVARGDFGICLSRQGWRWHTVSTSTGQGLRMTLVMLKKGSKRLMLMLWESAPGKCGFSLGEDHETDKPGGR